MKWLDRLFNQHKFVRRFTVFWAIGVITYVVLRVYSDEVLPMASPHLGAITIAVIGILSTVFALYKWLRERDQ